MACSSSTSTLPDDLLLRVLEHAMLGWRERKGWRGAGGESEMMDGARWTT